MTNFSVSVIITIGVLWSSIDCVYTYKNNDEFFQEDHTVEGRLMTKQQNKQKVISCPKPTTYADKIFTGYDLNGEPITNLSTWSQLPTFTSLIFRCSDGYLLSDGNDNYTSVCNPFGVWVPDLKPCLRVCPTLHIADVELTCKDKRQGIIDCNGPLPSGSQVTAKCKSTYHDAGSESQLDYYDSMRCNDDGRWNKDNFNCVPDCGKPILQPLIANGIKSKFGEFPWHTAIYHVPKNHLLICGGTLITTNMVLSAAHCFFDEGDGGPKKDAKDYVVVVGKTTRNYNNTDTYVQKKFEVSEILFPEHEYNPLINGHTSDIAIVILKENVTLSPYVLPACFKRHGRIRFKPEKNNIQGAVPGWGYDENNTLSETLKFARLNYVDYKECSKKVAGVTLDKFCAGADIGPTPLKGDSGGGIVFKIGTLYYIRGIVSTRDISSYSSITTFTDISYYEDWIQSVIDERSEHKTTPSSTLSTPTRISTKKIIEHSTTSTSTSRTRVTSFRPTSPPQKPSLQEPLYKQIIKKKCVEYAEARFQNVCISGGNTTNKAKNCTRVMDCKRVETLIIGGTEASEKEFPHMALLIGYVGNHTEDDDEIIGLCGGTLISESFILTAAQCADPLYGELPKWALLGVRDHTNLTSEQKQKNRLPIHKKMYIHPGFHSHSADHDIALIQLEKPVKFSAHIRPVCLHTDYDLPKEYLNDATILGWGRLGFGEAKSSTLQKATVRFLANEVCSETFAMEPHLKNGFDNKTMICAGDQDSKSDRCQDDWGGPIQIRHEMECMYVQVGIISLGPSFCGDRTPSVYTRISSHLDWIQKIVWPVSSDH